MMMRNCPSVQASNEETKEHLYETLMAECRDTIQAVREELKSEAVRSNRWCSGQPELLPASSCELMIHTFIPSVQKQRERSSDPESGKVSNLQYLHR